VEFAQVFLEIKVPAKPFATDVTRERLLVIVRVHVKRQIVHLFGILVHTIKTKQNFKTIPGMTNILVPFRDNLDEGYGVEWRVK